MLFKLSHRYSEGKHILPVVCEERGSIATPKTDSNVKKARIETVSAVEPLERSPCSGDSSTPPMSVEAAQPPMMVGEEEEEEETVLHLDNSTLELLFDRLMRLEHESSARRMSKILHAAAGSVANNGGAEVLYPKMMVSFDLRRLPLEVIMQLAEVITEDETLSTNFPPKPASTQRPSSSQSRQAALTSGPSKTSKTARL